ncbi:hypothetical protein FA95DRAFT_1551689 [Auriscalpium vulgare]|uniref:Uncharacterized protein n=1 Tax=Auriscalpium vulgare TaxID=40419 RepID=A0ACB8SCH1_9AGAM|nr:hypothetical protein FA95DRAFT_1551689 [Auriscalpium vulgare]
MPIIRTVWGCRLLQSHACCAWSSIVLWRWPHDGLPDLRTDSTLRLRGTGGATPNGGARGGFRTLQRLGLVRNANAIYRAGSKTGHGLEELWNKAWKPDWKQEIDRRPSGVPFAAYC